MGSKINMIMLKDRMFYRPVFDSVPTEGDESDVIYDEIIIYDGGGVTDESTEG